jgi:arabinogalactan oligomer/maltooligosaccharide transport system permease protein
MTWSEWVIAGILLGTERFTLPVGLVTFQGRWETSWNQFSAMSILYSLPIVALFTLARLYILAGMTLGEVKG